MKIFAAGIATETNMFSPLPTGLSDFLVQRGADVRRGEIRYPGLDLSPIWGTRAAARGDEFVFGMNAWAQPAGITVRSAYEALREELLTHLRAAMPVDVVLLMLHGAMVADGYDDCEEDIIRRVRTIAGQDAVIGVELDLHCHLSESKIACADIVVTYKEYPHVDVNDRAADLFDLAVATRLGEIRPKMALFDCRMIGFYPTSRQPLRGFVDAMKAAERHAGVLSISFGHGFQLADLPHGGAKVLVVADADEALSRRAARDFGLQVYGLRRQIGFESVSRTLEAALSAALASTRTPVVVADQADNTGGGAPGDATFALRWLLEHDVSNAALAILYDPEVVRLARRAGIGARLAIRLGGKIGVASGDPLDIEVDVISFRDDYTHDFPQESGPPVQFWAGNVAALRCAGIDIIVSSERCQCCSPSIFADLGVPPASKRLLVVKSMQHFYSAFAPLAGEIIYMAGPGAVAPDPRQLAYSRLATASMYPWVDDPLEQSA
ncbi:MAG TPA: M81 family metallopeptidase [Steroidobacteraceae bacterium]|jgi:microcystin degradation protein MlrC|nr:M81 family metallopeptidase [Steroidobacteraceae bacterium]